MTDSEMDPLGPRPSLADIRPYRAPRPEQTRLCGGLDVWHLARPELPIVTISLCRDVGSANDSQGAEGLNYITTFMLDEGAGPHGALELSNATRDLGARLYGSAYIDGSRMTLTVLEKNLEPAFSLLAHVIARPRFEPKEWTRMHQQWVTRLQRRVDEADDVARVVSRAVMYGPDQPYRHTSAGLLESAQSLTVEDARAHYEKMWQSSDVRVIAGGSMSTSRLESLAEAHLGDWLSREDGPRLVGLGSSAHPVRSSPAVIFVERPEAPQSVVTVLGRGLEVGHPDVPLVDLLGTVLGGSFTSRLNQNLREERGWTYGAHAYFTETRGVGCFLARSSVHAAVTGETVEQILAEIRGLRDEGMTQEELAKAKAQALTERIQSNETIQSAVGRLSTLTHLGLQPDHDARSSLIQQAATLGQLGECAERYLDPDAMTVVVVGPAEALDQLRALGRGEPEMWLPEGRPAEGWPSLP